MHFNPDGTLIAASDGTTVRLFEVAEGKERASFSPRGGSSGMQFSPDSKRLATFALELGGVVQLWDTATGKNVVTLDSPGSSPSALAFTKDSRELAVLLYPGDVVALCDPTTGTVQAEVPLERRGAMTPAFTPESDRLLVFFNDGVIRQYPRSALRPGLMRKKGQGVTGLEFDREGKLLIDQQSQTGPPVARSADGKLLATADGKAIKLLGVPDNKVRLSFAAEGTSALAIAPDNRTVVSGGSDGSVRFWQLATGQELLVLRPGIGPITALAFDTTGTTLAAGGSRGRVRLWYGPVVK
jgi:WD40 repeat protein